MFQRWAATQVSGGKRGEGEVNGRKEMRGRRGKDVKTKREGKEEEREEKGEENRREERRKERKRGERTGKDERM